MNDLYRMVTMTNGQEEISSILLTLPEVAHNLEAEELLHSSWGWQTERIGEMLSCKKGNSTRLVWPRREKRTENLSSILSSETG